MSVVSIRNRVGRIEGDRSGGRRPVVVIFPRQTNDEAFAEAGVAPGADTQLIRVSFVSAKAA